MDNETYKKRYLKILTRCSVTLTLLAVTVALVELKSVLMPLTIALLLHIMLLPITGFLSGAMKLPHRLAVFSSFSIGIGCLSLFGLAISYALNQFSKKIDAYREKISAVFDSMTYFRDRPFLDQFDFSQMWNIAQTFSIGAMSLAGTLTLILIFLIFLMATNFRAPASDGFIAEIKSNVSRYIWIKTVVSLTTAVLVGLSLHVIGLELAIVFGIVVLFLNFIPNLGSIVATLVPLPFAYLQFGMGIDFFLVLIIPGLIQMTIGNIFEPKWMGDSFGIHPVIVLAFLLFWGIVWGAVGMFLAVPITAVIKIVSTHTKELHSVARFLEGDFSSLYKKEFPHDTGSLPAA